MHVLISGATGFIGSRLCQALAEAGHQCSALTRRSTAAALEQVPGLSHAIFWTPTGSPPPKAAFADTDAVVHLAGERVTGRWTARKRQAIRDSRVLGTRNLVEAIGTLGQRPRVLVCASAVGYYGDRGEETLTEESSPGQGFLADVCREWEEEAVRAEEFGLRVVRLRIGIVLAGGGGALEAMLTPFRLGLGGPIGNGRQWWSWIHRDDVAALIRHALEGDDLHGAVNATAPEPLRQREFARTLGRVLRRPALVPTPGFALKAALGGFAGELLASARVLPAKAQGAGFTFRFPELRGALEEALA